jgi:histidyl-tRNA synthetase
MLLPSLLHRKEGKGGKRSVESIVIHLEPDAKLSKLLSSAAAAEADIALILGETEMEKGLVSVKNLKKKTQEALLLPWLDPSNALVLNLINQSTDTVD